MKITKIIDEKLEEYVLVAMMIFLVIIVAVQVFFRFVINFSFGWSEELARYLLIWIAWIAASYAVRENAHIRVEIVKDLFGDKIKKIIEVVVLLICFSFALFLAIEGTKYIFNVKATNQVSPSLGIDIWIVYLAVPVGGILMSFRFIQQIIFIFKPPVNAKHEDTT